MNGQMINNMIQKYNSAEGSYRTDGQGSAADFFNPENGKSIKEPAKSYRLSIENAGKTHPDVTKGINLIKNAGKIGEAGVVSKKSAVENLKNSLASGVPADICKDRMVLLSNTMTEEGYKKAAEQGFSSGSICLVLASEGYSEDDYIRNYDDFLKYIKETK